jgi:DNA-binding MarR family transcriptional regulator
MPGAERVHPGQQGLVIARGGRVAAVVSPTQARLLFALPSGRAALPIHQATRAMWPGQTGSLTASQRASAARSITRLVEHGLVERRPGGVGLTVMGALFVIARRVDGLGA